MKATFFAILGAVLVMNGCGSSGETAKPGEGKLDEAEQFFLKSVKKDLEDIKSKLAKGEDAKYDCVAGESYGKEIQGKNNAEAETTVKEILKLCKYDVPLKALEGAVTKAEEARKAKPDEAVLSECFSADYSMSSEDLTKNNFAADEKVKALTARWDVACPPKK
jgi:hypothetical protein